MCSGGSSQPGCTIIPSKAQEELEERFNPSRKRLKA